MKTLFKKVKKSFDTFKLITIAGINSLPKSSIDARYDIVLMNRLNEHFESHKLSDCELCLKVSMI